MKHFPVDDDLVNLVWHLAEPRPFENLSFSDALRRVLDKSINTDKKNEVNGGQPIPSADELIAELMAMGKEDELSKKFINPKLRKRARSPSAYVWSSSIPELFGSPNLRSWKQICDHLGIEVAGDSARRKLKEWVKINRKDWPAVPDAESD